MQQYICNSTARKQQQKLCSPPSICGLTHCYLLVLLTCVLFHVPSGATAATMVPSLPGGSIHLQPPCVVVCNALSWCLAAAAAIYPAQHGSWGALEVQAGASRTPIDHSHFVSHTLLTHMLLCSEVHLHSVPGITLVHQILSEFFVGLSGFCCRVAASNASTLRQGTMWR